MHNWVCDGDVSTAFLLFPRKLDSWKPLFPYRFSYLGHVIPLLSSFLGTHVWLCLKIWFYFVAELYFMLLKIYCISSSYSSHLSRLQAFWFWLHFLPYFWQWRTLVLDLKCKTHHWFNTLWFGNILKPVPALITSEMQTFTWLLGTDTTQY